ncbi:MAG: homocysteine S-methyltransferase family protein [Anaerolineae bacterium]|nr:homocysteine S-methyltransferase family protein [Anaerolineae bacterium]MDW8099634.1 homocysteine S-methyltransferase family protein [Anaerolineae bacterium]
MSQNLIERLRAPGVIIADGATGTMLQRAGLPIGAAPERWVWERPDKVLELHRAYVEAGAEILLTCTFGGNLPRLRQEGLDAYADEINRRAVELARQAASDRAFVAGDIGPTGELLAPLGTLSFEEAVELYRRQAMALAQAGVDLFQIETMSDLKEMRAAVEGARHAAPDTPIFATMSFDTDGRTMMGVRPQEAAELLRSLEVTAMGANCGREIEESAAAVRAMRAVAPELPAIIKPNAGLPRMEQGRPVYDLTPEALAAHARQWAAEGFRVIGGCCGTTPDHIRSIVQALHDR